MISGRFHHRAATTLMKLLFACCLLVRPDGRTNRSRPWQQQSGKLQCTVGLAIPMEVQFALVLPHYLERYYFAHFAFRVARQHALCLHGDPLADHRVHAGVCDTPGQQAERAELSTRSLCYINPGSTSWEREGEGWNVDHRGGCGDTEKAKTFGKASPRVSLDNCKAWRESNPRDFVLPRRRGQRAMGPRQSTNIHSNCSSALRTRKSWRSSRTTTRTRATAKYD